VTLLASANTARIAARRPWRRKAKARSRGTLGTVPIPALAKSLAAIAPTTLTQSTAAGPFVRSSSTRTPRHPIAAPTMSTPYTRPIGKGLRVRARLIVTPAKKNGSARQIARSHQLAIAVSVGPVIGAKHICTVTAKAVVSAKAPLKQARSWDKVAWVKRSRRRYTQTDPAVRPNIAMLMTKNAR